MCYNLNIYIYKRGIAMKRKSKAKKWPLFTAIGGGSGGIATMNRAGEHGAKSGSY